MYVPNYSSKRTAYGRRLTQAFAPADGIHAVSRDDDGLKMTDA